MKFSLCDTDIVKNVVCNKQACCSSRKKVNCKVIWEIYLANREEISNFLKLSYKDQVKKILESE